MTAHTSSFESSDFLQNPEEFRKFLAMIGPDVITQSFRQPVLLLWMALPPAKRDMETLKATAREQYERVLSSFESGAELLELCKPPPGDEKEADDEKQV